MYKYKQYFSVCIFEKTFIVATISHPFLLHWCYYNLLLCNTEFPQQEVKGISF